MKFPLNIKQSINDNKYYIDNLSLSAFLIDKNGSIPDWMIPLINIHLLYPENNSIYYYYIQYWLPIPENLGCDYKGLINNETKFDINRKNINDENIISLYIKSYQNDIPNWMKQYNIDLTKTFNGESYLEIFKEYCSKLPIPSWIIK